MVVALVLLLRSERHQNDFNALWSKLHRSIFNADGLLAEWGVHHFHLSAEPDLNDPRYVKRGGPLVFALVDDCAFYAINVYQHGDWERLSIVESLHRNWPEVISKYRLRGVAPEELEEQKQRTLRKEGIHAALRTADGTVYGSIGGRLVSCPGDFVSTDAAPRSV